MELEINKSEKYAVIVALSETLDETMANAIEKNIAKMYASEGMINYVLDISKVNNLSEPALKLFSKVQKICNNESGLWVLVSANNNIVDDISAKTEEYVLVLPTVEEAIDAVFMNELENDFRDEHNEEEFGEPEY
jgi:anti-anti-sigma factor